MQHFGVVHEAFGVSAEPQPERRGHGDLQVRVAGHQHLVVSVGKALQQAEQALHVLDDLLDLTAQENPQVDQYLVVSRTSAVNLLARVADPFGEQELHLGMDVFDTFVDREASGYDVGMHFL